MLLVALALAWLVMKLLLPILGPWYLLGLCAFWWIFVDDAGW